MNRPLNLPFTPEEQAALRSALCAAMRCMSDAQMLGPLHPENAPLPQHRRAICRLYWRLSRQEEMNQALAVLPWWWRWQYRLRRRFWRPEHRAVRLARRFIQVARLAGCEDAFDE